MEEKYRLKWVSMQFPRALTEHEENILIVNLQAVPNETKKALRAAFEKLQRKRFEHLAVIPGVGAAVNFMKSRAAVLSGEVDNFFYMTKTDNRTYHFGYAYDDLKAINAKFSIINRQLKLPEPSLINERLLVEGIKRKVFADMGFKSSEVKIAVSEIVPPGVNYE